MINEQTFFDQPVKNDTRTYDNIRKITNVQGDAYATGCLLDYPYFKTHYNTLNHITFINSSPCHCTYLCSIIISMVTTMCKQQALLEVKDIYCVIFQHLDVLHSLLVWSYIFPL